MCAVIRCSAMAVLVVAALGLSARSAAACGCFEFPACANVSGAPASGIREAEAIFVGRVLEHSAIETRFRIERMFVGRPAQELTLGPLAGTQGRTGNVVSTCDMHFRTGERYLVYARRHSDTGDLVTSTCARNKLMSDPRAKADVAYLDARAKGLPTSGWVSGMVEEGDYTAADGTWESRRLAGVRVIATPPAGEKKVAITNDDGFYFFSGLTPAWRLTADLPPPYMPHDGMIGRRDGSETGGVEWLSGLNCAEADIHARRTR